MSPATRFCMSPISIGHLELGKDIGMRRQAPSQPGRRFSWWRLRAFYRIPSVMILAVTVIGLVAASSMAQETGPVTVTVRFDDEVSFGAGCVPRSTLCASERNSSALFNEILLPGVATEIEQAEIARQRRKSLFPLQKSTTEGATETPTPMMQRPRVVGGQVGYERVSLDFVSIPDIDGNIVTMQSHLLWDVQDYTLGVLIPFDIMALDGFDVTRLGLIGLGQYRFLVNTRTLLTSTVNANYSHASVDAPGRSDVSVFGGGAECVIDCRSRSFCVAGGALSYQLHSDDSDLENKTQHLFKVGAQAGLRVQKNLAMTLSGTLNYDLTSYSRTVRDVEAASFDLGVEVGWSPTARWKLTGRYQKVLGLDRFSSDQVTFEALWRF